ncbi:MAG: alpha/beta fold hydrolase [Thiogranum sp.]|nr:alpha/beta fold hydrolase [Thiogranum sp.]
MSGYVQRIFGLLALLTVQTASADILLLVHGYASSAQSWEISGVNNELQARGWVRAGIMAPSNPGLMPPAAVPERRNRSYSADLPAQAPLLLQAEHLRRMLSMLRARYPDEKLTVAGHSAGGVVGRFALMGGILMK